MGGDQEGGGVFLSMEIILNFPVNFQLDHFQCPTRPRQSPCVTAGAGRAGPTPGALLPNHAAGHARSGTVRRRARGGRPTRDRPSPTPESEPVAHPVTADGDAQHRRDRITCP
eukprot:191800-Hanusia_phi.AAC.1